MCCCYAAFLQQRHMHHVRITSVLLSLHQIHTVTNHLVDNDIPVERRFSLCVTVCPHVPGEILISEYFQYPISQGFVIIWFNQKATSSVFDYFWHGTDVRSYTRHPVCKRFTERNAKGLKI